MPLDWTDDSDRALAVSRGEGRDDEPEKDDDEDAYTETPRGQGGASERNRDE